MRRRRACARSYPKPSTVFETEGFVAARAEIDVQTTAAGRGAGGARIWTARPSTGARHTLLSEVKAVTYHQLTVERPTGGRLAGDGAVRRLNERGHVES